MRNDPTLVNFVEELRHIEPAARLSVQTVLQSVSTLITGLDQVKIEIDTIKGAPNQSPDDKFVTVMSPFVEHVSEGVQALKMMSKAVEDELQALLLYFGEKADSADAPKPEDLFSLILSFSSSLQVSISFDVLFTPYLITQ